MGTTEDTYRDFGPVGTKQQGISGADIASATTIAPTHRLHRVTGTTAIVNITVPYEGFEGSIILLPTGAFTTTNAGNIAIASTAVVGKALIMTYLAATDKWYPSY